MKELERHNLQLKGLGSIYPILTKLKDQQWVHTEREVIENGKTRVYYEINENGRCYLQQKIKEWRELQHDITSLLHEMGKEES